MFSHVSKCSDLLKHTCYGLNFPVKFSFKNPVQLSFSFSLLFPLAVCYNLSQTLHNKTQTALTPLKVCLQLMAIFEVHIWQRVCYINQDSCTNLFWNDIYTKKGWP